MTAKVLLPCLRQYSAHHLQVMTLTGVTLNLLPLNDETASEILRLYLTQMKFEASRPNLAVCQKLNAGSFAALTAEETVAVLHFLGDLHFSHPEVIEFVEAAQDKVQQFRKERV